MFVMKKGNVKFILLFSYIPVFYIRKNNLEESFKSVGYDNTGTKKFSIPKTRPLRSYVFLSL